MIKITILNKLKEVLSKHPRFESFDFDIKTKHANEGLVAKTDVNIHNLGNESYKLRFTISPITNEPLKGSMTPGRVSLSENFQAKSIGEVYDKINEWQQYIWEEIELSPIVRRQNEQQAILDDLVKRLGMKPKDAAGYYSAEEGEDLKIKLDALEQKYRDLIENLVNDTKQREDRIHALETDIETLKSTVTAINKGAWHRSVFGKMIKWGADKDNRDFAKQLYDAGVDLLNDQKLLGP